MFFFKTTDITVMKVTNIDDMVTKYKHDHRVCNHYGSLWTWKTGLLFLRTTDTTIMSLPDYKSNVTMPLINMIIHRCCMVKLLCECDKYKDLLNVKKFLELLSCITRTYRSNSVQSYLTRHHSDLLLTNFFKKMNRLALCAVTLDPVQPVPVI